MAFMKKKSMDSEVDLVAFISLLSVCICFLLLTVVWVQVGSMQVKQAVGGQPAEEAEKKPTLWALVQKDGSLELRLDDVPRKVRHKYRRMMVKSEQGVMNLDGLKAQIETIRKDLPALSTALIQPQAKTAYEHVISLMDTFKDSGMTDLGVAPLAR